VRPSDVNCQISYLNTLTRSGARARLPQPPSPCLVLVPDSVGLVAL
jgi:hypothetical protein